MKIVFCIPSTTKNRDDNNKSLEIITSLSKIRNYKNKPDIYIGYDIDDPIYIQKENNLHPITNVATGITQFSIDKNNNQILLKLSL